MAGPTHIDKLSALDGAEGRLKNISSLLETATQKFDVFGQAGDKLNRNMSSVSTTLERLFREASKAKTAKEDISGFTGRIQNLTKELDKLSRTAKIGASLQKIAQGFDKVGKSILSLNIFSLGGVFKFITSSIQRVYELQERWARAIGEFNKTVGAASPNMKSFSKEAMRWSGIIRGMTNGDIGEGLQMFAEFGQAFGEMSFQLNSENKKFAQVGLELARGFNLGGEAAGKLLKNMKNLGMTAKESSNIFGGDVVMGAKQADVSINVLAKDISESTTYMMRFGKAGVKTFVAGAAYARKFGFAIKELQKMSEVFDTFDSAAEASAKMNVAFGTTINAMDMMLTQDPAARFEKIRTELMSVGKSYESLSYSERRLLVQTTQLNEEELAAMLDQKNAGVSYNDFKKKQMDQEVKEASAKKMMQVQLRKTAQTMYAFGAAFDRITVAIANAIKPFLVMLGLAKDGNKPFKSFGQVMGSITDKIVGFFNALGKSSDWQGFMQEMADDAKSVAGSVGDMMSPKNVTSMARRIVPIIKSFYELLRDGFKLMYKFLPFALNAMQMVLKHSRSIVAVWAGMKIAGAMKGFISSLGNTGLGGISKEAAARAAESRGRLQDLAKPLGSNSVVDAYDRIHGTPSVNAPAGQGRLGRMGSAVWKRFSGVGAAGGALQGAMMGGGIGGIAGGALGGAFFGPIGAAVGNFLGRGLGSVLKNLWHTESALEKAMKKRQKAEEELSDMQRANEATLNALRMKNEMRKTELDTGAGIIRAHRGKGKKGRTFSGEDQQALQTRLHEMMMNKGTAGIAGSVSARFANSMGGPATLSAREMKDLSAASSAYQKILDTLAKNSEKLNIELIKEMEAKQFSIPLAKITLEEAQNKKAIVISDIKLKKLKEDTLKFGLKDAHLKRSAEGKAADALYEQEKKLNESLKTQAESIQEKLLRLQMKNEETKFQYEMAHQIQMTEEFKQFALNNKSLTGQALLHSFLSRGPKVAGYDANAIRTALLTPRRAMASGGIVTRPTHTLIGEAGPEAVIPLRAMGRGLQRQPSKFGGSTAAGLVNYAAGGGQQTVVKVVAGDVYLDGKLVGRHLVREVLASRNL